MADTLPKEMGSLQINENNDVKSEVNNTSANHEEWGFPLNDLYKMALHFYKGNCEKQRYECFVYL